MKSIVTKYTQVCAFCGSPVQATHHLVFGRSERVLADKDELTLPVCDACHNMGRVPTVPVKGQGTMIIHGNSMAEAMSKMMGQLAFEKEYYRRAWVRLIDMEDRDADPARESFRNRYGKSYL